MTITNLEKNSLLRKNHLALESFIPNELQLESKVSQMRDAVDEFEELLKDFSPALPARKIKETHWRHFYHLDEKASSTALTFIRKQNAFMREIKAEGLGGSYDEVKMLKHVMERYSLLFSSEIADKIESEDVIEILDQDYTQVYRSYNCFSLCNYSILELSTYPWYELYDRSPQITKLLIDVSQEIMMGKRSFIDLAEVFPTYTLQEKMTDDCEIFQIREKFFAQTRSTLTGQIYMVTTKRITPVAKTPVSNLRFI